MPMKSVLSHSAQAILEGSLVALLVVGLVAGTALAGKGGGGKPSGGSGTISVKYMDGATAAHFGARVTFDLYTTATLKPFAHLKCFQGGSLVLEGYQGFFDSALGNPWMYLGPSPLWQGGEADCTATIEKYTSRGFSVLGSTSFHVYP